MLQHTNGINSTMEIDRERTGDLIVCRFVDKHSLFLRVIQDFILPSRLKCSDGVCRTRVNSEVQYTLVSYLPIRELQAATDNVTVVTRNVATFDCSPMMDRIQFAFMLTLITLLVMLLFLGLRGFGFDFVRRVTLGANRQKQH
jgi:hypothetical protein